MGECQVAGPQSGINVVQKAQQAVNTAKVVNALNKISGILRVRPHAPLSTAVNDTHASTPLVDQQTPLQYITTVEMEIAVPVAWLDAGLKFML